MELTKDFKCDLNCPAVGGIFIDGICCNNCYRTKKKYLTEDNKRYWTVWDGKPASKSELINGVVCRRRGRQQGFYDPEKGCRLPRELMPAECKKYDCKEDIFYMTEIKYTNIKWDGEKWVQVRPVTLYARGVILKNHFEKLMKRVMRDLKKFCNYE